MKPYAYSLSHQVPQKHLLFFHHMPKCGGTSFVNSLRHNYVVIDINPYVQSVVEQCALYFHLLNTPIACTGHVLSNVNFNASLGFEKHYCFTLIRHPFERAVSSYFFQQNTRYSIDDLGSLNFFLDKVSNFYTKRFAQGDLKKAVEILLSRYFLFGITEYYESSLSIFNYFFNTKLSMELKNVNTERPTDKCFHINSELENRFKLHNENDYAFYKTALDIFQKRLSETTGKHISTPFGTTGHQKTHTNNKKTITKINKCNFRNKEFPPPDDIIDWFAINSCTIKKIGLDIVNHLTTQGHFDSARTILDVYSKLPNNEPRKILNAYISLFKKGRHPDRAHILAKKLNKTISYQNVKDLHGENSFWKTIASMASKAPDIQDTTESHFDIPSAIINISKIVLPVCQALIQQKQIQKAIELLEQLNDGIDALYDKSAILQLLTLLYYRSGNDKKADEYLSFLTSPQRIHTFDASELLKEFRMRKDHHKSIYIFQKIKKHSLLYRENIYEYLDALAELGKTDEILSEMTQISASPVLIKQPLDKPAHINSRLMDNKTLLVLCIKPLFLYFWHDIQIKKHKVKHLIVAAPRKWHGVIQKMTMCTKLKYCLQLPETNAPCSEWNELYHKINDYHSLNCVLITNSPDVVFYEQYVRFTKKITPVCYFYSLSGFYSGNREFYQKLSFTETII